MSVIPDKRTLWARRGRGPYRTFTGCRIDGEQLAKLEKVAKTLNVDVSDALRACIAIAALSGNIEDSKVSVVSDPYYVL